MQIPLPVLAALAGALAGGVFSFLNQILVERRKRREEASLRHLQRQIEELYGPLYGLIQFGAAINEIEWLRLPKESRDEHGRPRDEQGGKVIGFFREHYYLPLNEQMMELIRTKVYLLDSDGIPDSFANFIRHAAQLDCFHQLWKEVDISTHGIKPIVYPTEFKSDVENTLNKLRKRYNEYIRRLKGRRHLKRRQEIEPFSNGKSIA
jgi:hypothetical protein